MKTDTNLSLLQDNARSDERLLRLRMRHKAAGYGVYYMLLDILMGQPGHMCSRDYNVIAFELREDAGLIKSVVENFGLFAFTQDGKCFYSELILQRMEKVGKVSKARREAAQKRWGTHDKKSEEDYLEQIKMSEVWLIDMEIKHNCTRDEIIRRIEEFAVECRCRCNTHKSRQDMQRHFHEWLTQIENERKARAQARAAKAQAPVGVESLRVYDQWAEAICMKYRMTHDQLLEHVDRFVIDMQCGEKDLDNINNIRQYFNGWLRSHQQEEKQNATANQNRQPIAAGRADRAAAVASTMAALGASKEGTSVLPY